MLWRNGGDSWRRSAMCVSFTRCQNSTSKFNCTEKYRFTWILYWAWKIPISPIFFQVTNQLKPISFLTRIKLFWTIFLVPGCTGWMKTTSSQSLILKIRKKDKWRILVPYLQHIHILFDEIEQKRNEVRLFINVAIEFQRDKWRRSISFTHKATMETVVMDTELKNKIKADLENFLKPN